MPVRVEAMDASRIPTTLLRQYRDCVPTLDADTDLSSARSPLLHRRVSVRYTHAHRRFTVDTKHTGRIADGLLVGVHDFTLVIDYANTVHYSEHTTFVRMAPIRLPSMPIS
jgi:hypothetical protein